MPTTSPLPVTIEGTPIQTSVTFHGDWDSTSTPVILIHGTGGTTQSNYAPVLPLLSAHHRLLGVDTRPDDAETVGLDQLHHSIESAITSSVDSDQVDLIGYSLGAVIAASLAARMGRQVRRLIALGGWARTDPQRLLRNQLWLDLNAASPELLAKYWVLSSYGHIYLAALEPERIAAMAAATRVRSGTVAEMHLNRRLDIREQLPKITAKTMVIGGSQDQTIPLPHSAELAAGIPGADLVVVDAGHALMAERPGEVSGLMLDFLS
ncbi:alpha/beta hydrolase [Microbacterium sp. ARD31]|uniref:alpha/beta fold hydrolase n=1 Tax=Microbacterium sp. ARD31 TaxID=2962576 RepID=UPI0028814F70|nr:alpha/beta hydrolase [Microbacterium sp. ARD31]MDT0186062.1 alpha/beta hydrolase [Microbacterium sp. ARD31]